MKISISHIRIGPRHRKDMGRLDNLAESISKEGLLQPIGITQDNELVFGDRRLKVCRDCLGWTEIDARIVNVTSLVAGEFAENEVRKDFTTSERVAIVETLRTYSHGGDRSKTANAVLKSEDAAKKAGFGSKDTFERAKTVVEHGTPELVEAMDRGEVSINVAKDVATLPQVEQQEIVAKGERQILEAAKNIRFRKAEARRKERIDHIVEISKGNRDLETERKFPIIYADPPWRYETPPMGGSNRSIENHYPTMTLEEICALPVDDLATDDALLYLWATSPKLAECMKVIEAWGFVYRTSFVWVKDKIGMGYHARNQHELLLVAKRGELPPPPPTARQSSVIHAPRTEHSAKPVEFHVLIEGMYPELPKIELFCRSPRNGWEVWGNQAGAA